MTEAFINELPIDGTTFFMLADLNDDNVVYANADTYHYKTLDEACAGAASLNSDGHGSNWIVFECKAVRSLLENSTLTVTSIKKPKTVKEPA